MELMGTHYLYWIYIYCCRITIICIKIILLGPCIENEYGCTLTVIVVEFVTPFCAVPEIVTEYVPGVIEDEAVTVKVTDAFGVTVVLDKEHCRFELLVEQERVTGKGVFPVN
ncbi:hypothetical protein [Candidatus Nanopusillus massiliensis]|uniref:hypothetical protein n=1 Tax=Candidatus Nanopusillus massiliensis TaxID=2897163 RepID=UPI001E4BA9DC|nr:hypothetical protein [Candidatus Nanopusillus massiliensis]